MSTATPAPIPVNVITGALGVGKTTAISRLLAAKPESERWIVFLNEFTETGVDAVTVASAARGAFDVRLVPGGCLCCAGEEDFTRQLRELIRKGPRPDRLLIEPSGIGHPAAIVEEVLGHQSYGALRLDSIVCLVDPDRLAELVPGREDPTPRDQADVADVLILSKADLADPMQRGEFVMLAQGFYPPKRLVAEARDGLLPIEALSPVGARVAPTLTARPAAHEKEHQHAHEHAHEEEEAVVLPNLDATRHVAEHLGRAGAGWIFERKVQFSRPKLRALFDGGADQGAFANVERCKGVFRTGPETWLLVQKVGAQLVVEESSWRRDSRAEVVLTPGAPADWERWDALWHAVCTKS